MDFINSIFNKLFTDIDETEPDIQVAIMALLLEVANADDEVSTEETALLAAKARSYFKLNESEFLKLKKDAEAARHDAVDFYEFSKHIRDSYSAAERLKVMEMLWAVVVADGRIDPHEEHMVRQLSELLYVSHGDFIATKIKAMQGKEPV